MKSKISAELIDKYLKGECTSEEEEMILDWYDSFGDDPVPGFLKDEAEKEDLAGRMLQKIKSRGNIPYREERTVLIGLRTKKILFPVIGIAAALLIIFSFSLKWFRNGEQVRTGDINTFTRVMNSGNRISKYVFPDGSVSWLQPATTITFNRSFNGKLREVNLTGEAFFEVKRNTHKPFIIHTGDVITKVLGTSFNVKALKGTSVTEVVVATGKVLVSGPAAGKEVKNTAVLLVHDEKVVYSSSVKKLLKNEDTKETIAMWKKSDLSFDNTPVKEVVAELNSYYKTDIQIRDKEIGQYVLKADFSQTNLADVLEILSKSLNITYEIDGSGILVKKN